MLVSCLVIVVVDTSGSMREHGKAMLARGLIAHICEHLRFGDGPSNFGQLIVVFWGNETTVVELLPASDLPLLPVGGRAQMSTLLAVLDRLAISELSRVLLVSDGHLARSDLDAFKRWHRLHPDVSVRVIPVGPDAASAALAKLADPGGAFAPEEVVSALLTWELPQEPALPTSLSEVTEDLS